MRSPPQWSPPGPGPRLLPALLFLCCSAVAAEEAVDGALLRIALSSESVRVGEPLELRVTVLVPTWFAEPPVYPAFEIANAITRLPADSTFPVSEELGGERWSGIQRNYRIYPLLPGNYRLDEQRIRVKPANPGGEVRTLLLPAPELEFRAFVPPGAESLKPFLAGERLDLSLQLQSDAEDLRSGDAVLLHYRASLDGLPAMFIPPLAPSLAGAGLSVYAQEPEIDDGPPARRSETLTLLFRGPGEYDIPEVSLSYWNTQRSAIETVRVPARRLRVQALAGALTETSAHASPRSGSRWIAPGVMLALLLTLWNARAIGECLRVPLRRASHRWHRSTARASLGLWRSLREGDRRATYRALLHWLARVAPGYELRAFATEFGDAQLRRALEDLIAANFAAQPEPAVEKGAVSRLRLPGLWRAAYRCASRRRRARRSLALPSLNG